MSEGKKTKKQLWIVVDVETDGPAPGLYSMIQLGSVVVRDRGEPETFEVKLRPLEGADFVSEALAVTSTTRAETLQYPEPQIGMLIFKRWLESLVAKESYEGRFDVRLVLISDNLAFDWQFVNYYFHRFFKANPFGHSGRRIGDLWSGFNCDYRKNSDWKNMRQTKHTHNPVDDARGNAEALIAMKHLGLLLPF